jgi:hypothetical protein
MKKDRKTLRFSKCFTVFTVIIRRKRRKPTVKKILFHGTFAIYYKFLGIPGLLGYPPLLILRFFTRRGAAVLALAAHRDSDRP